MPNHANQPAKVAHATKPAKLGHVAKGNRYTTGTAPSAATRALWATPVPRTITTAPVPRPATASPRTGRAYAKPAQTIRNPWAPQVPSQATLNRLANAQMAGLGASAPTKGARGHQGAACTGCWQVPASNGACGC